MVMCDQQVAEVELVLEFAEEVGIWCLKDLAEQHIYLLFGPGGQVTQTGTAGSDAHARRPNAS